MDIGDRKQKLHSIKLEAEGFCYQSRRLGIFRYYPHLSHEPEALSVLGLIY